MKTTHALRSFLLGSTLLATASSLHATAYYWDDNSDGAAFGIAGASTGTWEAPTTGPTAGWSLSPTGADIFAGFTTLNTNATTDSVNFGNGATGLTAGTITVVSVSSGNMTFASGSGAILLSGGTITMAAASTITVNNTTNTINSILAGAATSLTKAGTGTLILTGANSYSGSTAINAGTLQIDTDGALAAITMGTGVAGTLGNVGNLTLNTNAAVTGITVKSNTATTTGADIGQISIASGSTLTATSFTAGMSSDLSTNLTFTALGTGSTPGTGGNLTVNGNMAIGVASTSTGIGTTVVDLSGLNTLNVTSIGAGSLTIGSNLKNKGTLTLANVANTLNVGTLSVGDSSTFNSGGLSTLTLGAGTNALQAPTINIGKGKSGGRIQFGGANGSVTITGAGGSGTATITIGSHTAGTFSGGGTNSLSLAGHSATVSASTVIIGQKSTVSSDGGAVTAALTFNTGTFTASSIQMAVVPSGVATTAGLITSTFTVGGATANSAATGVVNITNNLFLSAQTAAGVISTTNGTLTINGGTVNVNTTPLATKGIFDTSTVGTTATTLTLAGGTLNLNGGVIGGTTGTGKRNITNLNFQSGTLKNVLQINGGTSGLTKTTDGTLSGGTLILAGTNSYTGTTTVSAGTLALGADNVIPNASNVSLGAATLDAATFDDTAGTLDVTAAATINLGTGANLVFATGSPAWTGSLNITGTFVSGSSLRFGIDNTGLTVTQLGQITGVGAVTLDASGFLISAGGNTYATWIAANGPATGFDTDSDNDGIPNGVENILGSNPNTFNTGLTEVSSTPTSVVFKHNLNPTVASDVTRRYEWSTDLVEWKASTETNTGGTTATIGPVVSSGVVTVTINITGGPSAKLFGRLVAVK